MATLLYPVAQLELQVDEVPVCVEAEVYQVITSASSVMHICTRAASTAG